MVTRLIAIIWFLLACAPATLSAQERVEPTAEQKELNREAVRAAKAGDSDGAIAAFEKSLELGPLNVTYLNLGRAQQKAGRCREAWNAFDQVEQAPAVPKPARQTLLATLDKFRGELAASCPTQIEVTCENDNAQVRLGEDQRDCPATFDVDPGTHEIHMSAGSGSYLQTVNVDPGRTVALSFAFEESPLPNPVPEEEEVEQSPPLRHPEVVEPAPSSGPSIAGITVVSIGLGLFVASLFADGAILRHQPAYAKDHRVTGADFIPLGGYVLSVGAIVTGAMMLVKGAE